MGSRVKVRLTLATCGTCGKPRGIRHECVTRAAGRRRKRRTPVKPKVTVTCGKCGKPRGVRHTCYIRTDFARRKRRQARKARADGRRQRRQLAAARRREAARARKAPAKAAPKRPRSPAHNHETCTDPGCERYACRAYRDGFDDGIGACPRPHGVT